MKLSEWYPLNHEAINLVVRPEMGAYALSKCKGDDRTVHYVGRSDKDVNDRLGQYVPKKKYAYFQFTHLNTPKECFELECRLYHEHKPVDNRKHPTHPEGMPLFCPVADCEHASP